MKAQLEAIEKRYSKNFYVLDTETNGFKDNEPIQIAALLFENGKQVDKFNMYYLPENAITKEALEMHGKSRKDLQNMGAKYLTKGGCEMLKNFLNIKPDYPIVTHNVEYDRDKVLRPAFEKLEVGHLMPVDKRWKCTMDMTKEFAGLFCRSLDALLSWLEFDEREEEDKHEALKDCEATAMAYMKLKAMPPRKKAKLGWTKE